MSREPADAGPEEASISVVIPVLNEEQALPALLKDLAGQRGVRLQVIVADGGSEDDSAALAAQHGAEVVHCEAGRARQMNAAAASARHGWLLFLHADCRLTTPDQLARALAHLKKQPGSCAGHFALQFNGPGGRRLLYRFMAAKTKLNRRECFNGDQGLLIHRRFLRRLGGFDESLHFLEDQRIGSAVHEHGHWTTLPGELLTDTRRFDASGPRRQWLMMVLIMGAYGTPVPEFLARAPQLYHSPDSSGRLRLAPYFRLYASIMRERGWRGSLAGWLGLGHFAARHVWQLFLFVDVLSEPVRRSESMPLLTLYDKHLEFISRWQVSHALFALFVATLVFGIVWPMVEIGELADRLFRP